MREFSVRTGNTQSKSFGKTEREKTQEKAVLLNAARDSLNRNIMVLEGWFPDFPPSQPQIQYSVKSTKLTYFVCEGVNLKSRSLQISEHAPKYDLEHILEWKFSLRSLRMIVDC